MRKEPEARGEVTAEWETGQGRGRSVEGQTFWLGLNSRMPVASEQPAAHANLSLQRSLEGKRANLCVQQINGFNHGTRRDHHRSQAGGRRGSRLTDPITSVPTAVMSLTTVCIRYCILVERFYYIVYHFKKSSLLLTMLGRFLSTYAVDHENAFNSIKLLFLNLFR